MGQSCFFSTSVFAAALVCSALAPSILLAQAGAPGPNNPVVTATRIVEAIDDNRLAILAGNTHPRARVEFDRGRVSPALPAGDLFLILRRSPEAQAAFDSLVAEQYDTTSPHYHEWLSAKEVGDQFGPTSSDVNAVSNWLLSKGFSIEEVSPDRLTIRFSGTVAQVESCFHTELHHLEIHNSSTAPQSFIANMADPKIPAALLPVVVGVKALHNFFPQPLHRLGGQVTLNPETGNWARSLPPQPVSASTGPAIAARPRPFFGTIDGYGDLIEDVAPYDFATIYNVLPLWQAATPIDGTGQAVAIAGTSNINPADIAAFRSAFGLPVKAPSVIITNSNPGNCPNANSSCFGALVENSLDVEWAGAVAKGANIVLVTSSAPTATTDALFLSENYIVQHKTAPVMNVSYGQCELALGTAGNIAYNNLWQTAAAEGIAVVVASGDAGSPACDQGFDAVNGIPYAAQFGLQVSGITSTPYNTSVGGTDFNWGTKAAPYWNATNNSTTHASALGYIPEVPWNSTCINPLALPPLASDAAYLGAPAVTDAESACNFILNYGKSIYTNYGVELRGLLDTIGGGGGVSACTTSNSGYVSTCAGGYAKPAWQKGVTGIPADSRRDIPDVSFFASNGFLGSSYLICVSAGGSPCTYSATSQPTAQEVGGTSVGSPAMAGVMALINQKSGKAQGNPNSLLYTLASEQTYANCTAKTVKASSTCVFNDVNIGTNAMACINGAPGCSVLNPQDAVGVLGGYPAGVGYDRATGLGSLNVANIVNNWPTSTALPVVSLSASSLAFTATVQGASSASQVVALKNTGKSALSLNATGQGISIVGTNYTSFLQTNTCGTSLAAAASCAITVTFKPAAVGLLSASIRIGDNAYGSPQSVSLSGTGTAPKPAAVLSANSLSFSATKVGTSFSAPKITLSNPGSGALSVSSITIAGTNATSFSQTNTCGTTLAVGASCGITVTFKPTVVGSLTAALTVADNASGSPQKVALSGTGSATSVRLPPRKAIAASENNDAVRAQVAANYGRLPLRFEANQGQAIQSARYVARGSGYALSLNSQEAILTLGRFVSGKTPHGQPRPDVLRMQLAGANPQAAPMGLDQLPGTSNYLLGNDPSRWHTGVPSFAKVQYPQVYPGIDLVYYGNQQQLEYDFVVAPQANASCIHLHFAGAHSLKLDALSNLVIEAPNGQIAFHKPVAYQQIEGQRHPVEASFQLLADNSAAFALGPYDHSSPLVIDPTLVYATFLGGSNSDSIVAIAVDSSGAAYVTGTTASTDYPVTPGGLQSTFSTAFVTKLNSSGTALVYSTFLGGSGSSSGGDNGLSIAVDSKGNAYVTGSTYSTNFPVTSGAFQATNNSKSSTGFVSKINPAGTALVYSTYLGGTKTDNAASLALDSAGNAFIAGSAYSSDFPTTTGAFQTKNNSGASFGWNEYVAKLNPTGTALAYATYIGGSGDYGSPSGIRVAIDSAGEAFVSSTVLSKDFPVTATAFQKTNNATGRGNMTLARLNSSGTKLLYATYLGGSSSPYGDDVAGGLAVDSAGNAYLSGTTHETNFPVTSGAFQTTNNTGASGKSQGFVSKLNPTGSALVYSTYLGGTGGVSGDRAFGLTIDSAGDVYVTGSTGSSDFPVTKNAFQATNAASFNNGAVVFLTEFNPTATALLYSTYMGGNYSYADTGYGIALGSNGAIYLAGTTGAKDFPVTSGAYKTSFNSSNFTTGFLAEFLLGSAPATIPTTTTLLSSTNPTVAGTKLTFTAVVSPSTGTAIPTGNVVFNVDLANVATVALNSSGIATYTTPSAFALGQHAILASYAGNTTFSSSGGGLTESITPLAPVIKPATGVYSAAQLVTISDATPGTSVYYTLDGTVPTATSPKFTTPLLISNSSFLQAIAVSPGVPASAVAYASYKLVGAPTALAVPATTLGTTTATINGLVNPLGLVGTYSFQYGTSAAALTSSTPKTALGGSILGNRLSFIPVPVSAPLTGLKSKTTYYYQVVITTVAGTSSGQVLSFTTN